MWCPRPGLRVRLFGSRALGRGFDDLLVFSLTPRTPRGKGDYATRWKVKLYLCHENGGEGTGACALIRTEGRPFRTPF